MQSYINIKSIHLPLSQLVTAQFRREKWFNIVGNSAIVTRYRLDSQFHCPYLEFREVREKRGKIPGRKTRGKYVKSAGNDLPFTSGSGDVISGDLTSGDATSGDVISGDVTIPIDPLQIITGWCIYTTLGRANI